MKPKILAVIGPTASGKSELAVALAREFNGEVVNADSRQVYKGMDIGTGKITDEEMQGIPHHLLDIVTPDEEFNLYDYQKLAFDTIDEILERGKLPILVGGTGLFVSSVIENYNLSSAGVDSDLRRELHNLSMGELIKRLLYFNPDPKIDLQNRRRVVRQLEYYMLDPDYEPGTNEPRYEALIIQPSYDRAELYSKINARVVQMVESGLEDEVRRLKDRYGWQANAMTGIGYREWFQYFETSKPRDEKERKRRVVEQIKQHSRQYAKRQITWFKRYTGRILHAETRADTIQAVGRFLKG